MKSGLSAQLRADNPLSFLPDCAYFATFAKSPTAEANV